MVVEQDDRPARRARDLDGRRGAAQWGGVRRLFLQDCDETTTTQALSRLTRQSLAPFGQAPREIAWRRKPTTYIVCTEDLATPAQAQRQRVKGDTLAVDFPAGHHPFLSQPEAFARCLATVVRALQPSHS